MSEREAPTLGYPPDDTAALVDFPFIDPAGRSVWRVTRAQFAMTPWYYSASVSGRFNLEEPYGTCYWAEDPIGAILEVFLREADGGVVTSQFVGERRLVRTLSRSAHMADVNSAGARGYHITLEIGALPPPYDISRAWAMAFHGAGFGGVRWILRHDAAASHGLAYFGARSRQGTADENAQVSQFGMYWRLRLREECGIEVLDSPSINELTIAE